MVRVDTIRGFLLILALAADPALGGRPVLAEAETYVPIQLHIGMHSDEVSGLIGPALERDGNEAGAREVWRYSHNTLVFTASRLIRWSRRPRFDSGVERSRDYEVLPYNRLMRTSHAPQVPAVAEVKMSSADRARRVAELLNEFMRE